jgi:hypothetical protein
LSVVKDKHGNDYESESAREKSITKFYERLYADPDPNKDVNVEDIENFLGETTGTDDVRKAKLTDLEKSRLDREVHITELDLAIKQANKKSAPGLDGFNNTFINAYWNLFRKPLLGYLKCCLDKGQLTENFKTAKIRLIPKKGDLTKIGNWRPISLLGCFYKILSRVYTNRLKHVMDKITAIGQKGYSKTKVCQETLIPIVEAIKKCKKTK